MFKNEFATLCNAGRAKADFLEKNKVGYFVSALMAGLFIAFGGFITFTWGANLTINGAPAMVRGAQSFSFAAALSLIVMAGAELFTGNNLVMACSSLGGSVSWGETIKVWIVCYIGNLLGSLISAVGFQISGVPSGDVGAYYAKIAETKMHLAPQELIFRGIFCNILVCLAVWCGFKLKSEAAKLIMIFWCIFVFMICGFEHSIANMSVLAVGLMNAGDASVSIGGYIYNVGLVTLGNMIGGAIFVALPYYITAKEPKK